MIRSKPRSAPKVHPDPQDPHLFLESGGHSKAHFLQLRAPDWQGGGGRVVQLTDPLPALPGEAGLRSLCKWVKHLQLDSVPYSVGRAGWAGETALRCCL